MSNRELWIGLVHLKPLIPGDWSGFDGGEKKSHAGAYSHIITWASNPEEFRANAEKVASGCKLYVVDIENEKPMSDADLSEMNEELEDIAARVESNPNAIIWGSFFTYPHQDA